MNIAYAGVVTRPDSPEVEQIGREVIAWFEKRGIKAALNQIEPAMDMVLVLGGDGPCR